MFRGKPSKGHLIAGLLVTLLLQGCSSPVSDSNSVPSDVEEAEEDYKYNPKLSPVFDEPWPTDVTRQELIETALYKSFDYMDKIRIEKCPIKGDLFIDDTVIPEHVPVIEKLTFETTSVFCNYLTTDFSVIAGGYEFVKDVVASEGLPSDEFGGVCGYSISPNQDSGRACAVLGVAWIGKGLGTKRRGTLITDEHAVATVTHELFHLVHDSIDPGPASQSPPPGHPFYRPIWLTEGGGEFFGRLLPRYFDLQEYGGFTPTDRSGGFLEVSYLSDLSGLEIRRTEAGGSENYYSGQIALEYIAASVGMENLMGVWVRMGQGEKFEIAFKKAVGLSIPEFYEKFATMHDNLYDGDLVQ